jgi:enoyl-CoA hydratase/carnithine racemase
LTLRYEADAHTATVTLDRPEVLNAIDMATRDALWLALDAIEADDEVRVVVFRGAGERAFSAGADISEFGTAPSFTEARRSRLERDVWGRIAHLDKITIAAIHGYALGAGCELALLCDFRIAADDSRLGLPETHLGYVPTAGGSQTLPRTVGRGRALDMLMSAEPIDAAQALGYGLVHQVVPRGELDEAVDALVGRLVAQPADALKAAKRALIDGADLPLEAAIRLEARLASRLVKA